MNLSIYRNLLLALGCTTLLNSCELFNKNSAPAADPYAAASPYGQTPPAQGAYPAYGAAQPGAYDTGAGAYAQPTYTQPPVPQPYTQPPAGAGYAGSTGAGYANYSGGAETGTASSGAGSAASSRTHTVVKGDNLSKISRRYSVSVSELMRANNLNSDLIREGQKLNIP